MLGLPIRRVLEPRKLVVATPDQTVTEALALICKMIGDATGALTALATMVVSWFYGSTVGSARKTDVIQQIAGKGP